MRKLVLQTLIPLLLIVWIIPSLADCPIPRVVDRNCYGELQCEGMAGWHVNNPGWIGTTIGPDHHELHVNYFIKAEWRPLDGNMGTTFCWYRGDQGTVVRLTQGDFGGVSKPTLGFWIPSSSPDPNDPAKHIPDIKLHGFNIRRLSV